MPAGGLDGKKAVVKVLLSAIINDEPVTFDESGALPPTAPVHPPEPMTFGRAKTAVAGLILRRLPKPQFAPYKAPNIDLGDLTIRDYHSQNPVKAVVDLILNHREQISEDHVKNCVVNMKLEDLPAIARPPPTAIAINHFTQTAFLPAGSDNWHIVEQDQKTHKAFEKTRKTKKNQRATSEATRNTRENRKKQKNQRFHTHEPLR